MLGSDHLPGKRFILSENGSNYHTSSTHNFRNSRKFGNIQFQSGIIRSCNVEVEGYDSLPKNLKIMAQLDGSQKIIEIRIKNKFFLVEYLIVQVPGSPRRKLALLFKQLGKNLEKEVYVQHFGTHKIEKISRHSIYPFKMNEEKRSVCSKSIVEDFTSWLNTQKTQLFLLKGPYSIPSCHLEIYREDGKKGATLMEHCIFDRTLKVMFDNEITPETINPKISQVQFTCSDEGLNNMIAGNVASQRKSRHITVNNPENQTFGSWTPPSWISLNGKYNTIIQDVSSHGKAKSHSRTSSRGSSNILHDSKREQTHAGHNYESTFDDDVFLKSPENRASEDIYFIQPLSHTSNLSLNTNVSVIKGISEHSSIEVKNDSVRTTSQNTKTESMSNNNSYHLSNTLTQCNPNHLQTIDMTCQFREAEGLTLFTDNSLSQAFPTTQFTPASSVNLYPGQTATVMSSFGTIPSTSLSLKTNNSINSGTKKPTSLRICSPIVQSCKDDKYVNISSSYQSISLTTKNTLICSRSYGESSSVTSIFSSNLKQSAPTYCTVETVSTRSEFSLPPVNELIRKASTEKSSIPLKSMIAQNEYVKKIKSTKQTAYISPLPTLTTSVSSSIKLPATNTCIVQPFNQLSQNLQPTMTTDHRESCSAFSITTRINTSVSSNSLSNSGFSIPSADTLKTTVTVTPTINQAVLTSQASNQQRFPHQKKISSFQKREFLERNDGNEKGKIEKTVPPPTTERIEIEKQHIRSSAADKISEFLSHQPVTCSWPNGIQTNNVTSNKITSSFRELVKEKHNRDKTNSSGIQPKDYPLSNPLYNSLDCFSVFTKPVDKVGQNACKSIALLQNFLENHYHIYDDVCRLMSNTDKIYFNKALELVSKLPKFWKSDDEFNINFSYGLSWKTVYNKLNLYVKNCYEKLLKQQHQHYLSLFSQYNYIQGNTESKYDDQHYRNEQYNHKQNVQQPEQQQDSTIQDFNSQLKGSIRTSTTTSTCHGQPCSNGKFSSRNVAAQQTSQSAPPQVHQYCESGPYNQQHQCVKEDKQTNSNNNYYYRQLQKEQPQSSTQLPLPQNRQQSVQHDQQKTENSTNLQVLISKLKKYFPQGCDLYHQESQNEQQRPRNENHQSQYEQQQQQYEQLKAQLQQSQQFQSSSDKTYFSSYIDTQDHNQMQQQCTLLTSTQQHPNKYPSVIHVAKTPIQVAKTPMQVAKTPISVAKTDSSYGTSTKATPNQFDAHNGVAGKNHTTTVLSPSCISTSCVDPVNKNTPKTTSSIEQMDLTAQGSLPETIYSFVSKTYASAISRRNSKQVKSDENSVNALSEFDFKPIETQKSIKEKFEESVREFILYQSQNSQRNVKTPTEESPVESPTTNGRKSTIPLSNGRFDIDLNQSISQCSSPSIVDNVHHLSTAQTQVSSVSIDFTSTKLTSKPIYIETGNTKREGIRESVIERGNKLLNILVCTDLDAHRTKSSGICNAIVVEDSELIEKFIKNKESVKMSAAKKFKTATRNQKKIIRSKAKDSQQKISDTIESSTQKNSRSLVQPSSNESVIDKTKPENNAVEIGSCSALSFPTDSEIIHTTFQNQLGDKTIVQPTSQDQRKYILQNQPNVQIDIQKHQRAQIVSQFDRTSHGSTIEDIEMTSHPLPVKENVQSFFSDRSIFEKNISIDETWPHYKRAEDKDKSINSFIMKNKEIENSETLFKNTQNVTNDTPATEINSTYPSYFNTSSFTKTFPRQVSTSLPFASVKAPKMKSFKIADILVPCDNSELSVVSTVAKTTSVETFEVKPITEIKIPTTSTVTNRETGLPLPKIAVSFSPSTFELPVNTTTNREGSSEFMFVATNNRITEVVVTSALPSTAVASFIIPPTLTTTLSHTPQREELPTKSMKNENTSAIAYSSTFNNLFQSDLTEKLCKSKSMNVSVNKDDICNEQENSGNLTRITNISASQQKSTKGPSEIFSECSTTDNDSNKVMYSQQEVPISEKEIDTNKRLYREIITEHEVDSTKNAEIQLKSVKEVQLMLAVNESIDEEKLIKNNLELMEKNTPSSEECAHVGSDESTTDKQDQSKHKNVVYKNDKSETNKRADIKKNKNKNDQIVSPISEGFRRSSRSVAADAQVRITQCQVNYKFSSDDEVEDSDTEYEVIAEDSETETYTATESETETEAETEIGINEKSGVLTDKYFNVIRSIKPISKMKIDNQIITSSNTSSIPSHFSPFVNMSSIRRLPIPSKVSATNSLNLKSLPAMLSAQSPKKKCIAPDFGKPIAAVLASLSRSNITIDPKVPTIRLHDQIQIKTNISPLSATQSTSINTTVSSMQSEKLKKKLDFKTCSTLSPIIFPSFMNSCPQGKLPSFLPTENWCSTDNSMIGKTENLSLRAIQSTTKILPSSRTLLEGDNITKSSKVVLQDFKKSPDKDAPKKAKKTKYWYPRKLEKEDESILPLNYISVNPKRRRKKKCDEDDTMPLKKKPKPTIYLQVATCNSYPNLPKCMDCKSIDGETSDEAYCRFTMFRRISKARDGRIRAAGFCTTEAAEEHDLTHWTFQDNTSLDVETCKKILVEIGAQFEQLVLQELDASTWLKKSNTQPAWKRAVLRVREMCDICATTIFNTHWTCEACGFGVCLDCFSAQLKVNKNKGMLVDEWSDCEATDLVHRPKYLRLTKIIPKRLLEELYDDLLETCDHVGLKMKKLDLLEFSHHRNQDIKKSNMSWKEDLLATESIGEHLDTHIPSTPSECAWYCDGRMLHILKSRFSKDAMTLFKSEWAKGKPVIVSNVHMNLNRDLWTPQAFERDFGEELNDVVNCFDGSVMEKMPIRKFWQGFESVKDRPVCDQPVALLKLKDWPPGTDFKEKLPNRFNDIMQALPASTYTHRNGELNLSARLPDFFAVPDLGPKMYNAYGSASYPSAGTTNLHLDISDATNTIAYVGIPEDSGFREQEINDTLETVYRACCEATRKRIREPDVLPGALWHIFPAHSAEKIRCFLKRVAQERGMVLNETSDPIHDQAFYLDQPLLDRLKEEEGVEGYAICQCHGDAVFIPAGAPHQVLNLHSCIKVAEDFVAPEHISHCFQLTQEFRFLSDYHTNHEDKLQIKNIIYHSVKDCLGVVKKHIYEGTNK